MYFNHSQWMIHYAQALERANQLQQCAPWVHHNTIVLGIQDSRLPHLEKVFPIKENDFNVIVRNSGGLAVVT